MSVNGYLNSLAERAIIRDDERGSIQISIDNILDKLHDFNEIGECFTFGSYKRKTILSRQFDKNSDIDIMVVFRDGRYQPQTYLDWLKKFIEDKYSRSEIYQSSPTIVLELRHIKFELVPSLKDGTIYKIPYKPSNYSSWITTNPNELNGRLANNQELRRLVRVIKIWNAKQGYLFCSYELEKYIVERMSFCSGNLADRFFSFCSIFNAYNCSQNITDKISTLKNRSNSAKLSNDENSIKDLFE